MAKLWRRTRRASRKKRRANKHLPCAAAGPHALRDEIMKADSAMSRSSLERAVASEWCFVIFHSYEFYPFGRVSSNATVPATASVLFTTSKPARAASSSTRWL